MVPGIPSAYTVIFELTVPISYIFKFAMVSQHFKGVYECSMHFIEEEVVLVHRFARGILHCLPYRELRRDWAQHKRQCIQTQTHIKYWCMRV